MSTVTGPPPRRATRVLRDTDDLCAALGIGFSEEQLAAITAPLAPAVIIAGAGSGKTTVMAARVVWLVGTGRVLPGDVLGLTFTRKAAAELSHRIREALSLAGVVEIDGPDEADEPLVMTYDAFAARLVADHGLRIAVETDPTMVTGAARYRLASRVVAAASGPFQYVSRLRPGSLAERVLQLDAELTAHLVDHDRLVRFTDSFLRRLESAPLYRANPYKAVEQAGSVARERLELLDLVQHYQQLKRRLGLVEFADQMAVAARLVSDVPAVPAIVRSQFPVVLLDEYQDTSSAQSQLLAGLFTGPDPAHGMGHAVTAVGDPWQAIYGWRGAAASNILAFADLFREVDDGPATGYTLSVNRRSGQQVLDVANRVATSLFDDPALAAHSSHQVPTGLVAPPGTAPAQVHAATFETWAGEVDWIAERIIDDHRSGRASRWRDIAVLTRRNADIATVHDRLVDRDVPVEIVGLGGLLRLPEVADVVDTLRLVDDVTANPSVVRLLSGPRWRIGPRDLAILGRRAAHLARGGKTDRAPARADDLGARMLGVLDVVDSTDVDCLLDAIDDPGDSPLSSDARERLAMFGAELRRLRSHTGESALDLTLRVVATLGLDVELVADTRLERADRRAQLATFVDAVATYGDVDGDDSLGGLLAWLDAELEFGTGLDQAVPGDDDSVKLLTVHRAKGLEWDIVYLPALVDGVFPSDRGGGNWLRTPAVIPAPLRGDAEAVPQVAAVGNAEFKQFAEQLKSTERRGEDRLAYVAVTRARRVLVGTGYHWRPEALRARTLSPYLELILDEAARQGLVHERADPPASDNPVYDATSVVAWPAPPDPDRSLRLREAAEAVERARSRARLPAGYRPADVEVMPLDLQPVVARWDADIDLLERQARDDDAPLVEVPMPPALAASALMAAIRDPVAFAANRLRPMPRPVSAQSSLGTRFHDWVERRFSAAATLTDPTDLEPQPGIDDGAGGDDARLDRLVRAFLASEFAERVPLRVEQPFVLTLGSLLVRGRIDAVYADGDGRFLVVDWKTSSAPADPLQLSIYRLAWSQLAGVTADRVGAQFVHVATGRIERPRLLDGDELLAELSASTGRVAR
ncbi:MAG: ATP-dependent DNA helicase [Propionibacterium sp.]|nr:ATP-dependent DNA helicase [Propionibacterium sp.]